MIDPAAINVTDSPNANKAVVLPAAEAIVRELAARSGGSACVFTGMIRDAPSQVRVTFANLRTSRLDKQMALYGPADQQDIQVYDASNKTGNFSDRIRPDMSATIVKIGPSKSSRRCGDPKKLYVVDIAPNSIPHPEQFLDEPLLSSSQTCIESHLPGPRAVCHGKPF